MNKKTRIEKDGRQGVLKDVLQYLYKLTIAEIVRSTLLSQVDGSVEISSLFSKKNIQQAKSLSN